MNRSRVTGDLTASGLLYADIANDRVGIGSTIPGNKLSLPDNAKIGLGNAEDLTLVHTGSAGVISNTSSALYLRAKTNQNGVNIWPDGVVQLHHSGSEKLETQSWGFWSHGSIKPSADTYDLGGNHVSNRWNDIFVADTGEINIGDGGDLKIYHSGSHSFIQNTTGSLISEGDSIVLRSTAQENYLVGTANGSTELYFNGAKTLKTHVNYLELTGNASECNIQFKTSDGTQRALIGVTNSNSVIFRGGTEKAWEYVNNGALILYHDDSAKLSTASTGLTVTGRVDPAADSTHDLGTNSVRWRNAYADTYYGDGSNLTGIVADKIFEGDTSVEVVDSGSNGKAVFTLDGSEKVRAIAGSFNLPASYPLRLGNIGGTYVDCLHIHGVAASTGTPHIISSGYNDIKIEAGGVNNNSSTYHNLAIFKHSPASGTTATKVELYASNVKRFETTTSGIEVSGSVKFEGDVYSSNNNPWIYSSNGGSGTRAGINVDGTNQKLDFSTGGSSNVRLTIDASGNVKVPDSGKFVAGASNDLQIYHDGHSRIKTDSSAAGNLVIDSNNDINLRVNNSEMAIHCKEDGAVELYHNNVGPKLATTSGGISVTGSITSTGAVNSTDLTLADTTPAINFNDSDNNPDYQVVVNSGHFMIKDSSASADRFYINASSTTITNNLNANAGVDVTGEINLTSELNFTGNGHKYIDVATLNGGHSLSIRHQDGSSYETGLTLDANGAAKLFHNNIKTFETLSDGIHVLGPEGGAGLLKISADEGDDNADRWLLQANTDGTFLIRNVADGSWDTNIKCVGDGQVELYWNDLKKLETTSTGAKVTGVLEADNSSSNWPITVSGSAGAKILLTGSNNPYIQWQEGSTNKAYAYWDHNNNRFELKNEETGSKIHIASSTDLYHGANRKLATKSDGVYVTGELQCDSLDVDGAAEFTGADVTFYGASYNAYWDQSTNRFTLNDNAMAAFGSSQDLVIYHSSSDNNSYLANATGDIIIENSGGNTSNQIYIRGKTGVDSIRVDGNGAVYVYDQSTGSAVQKLSTYSSGIIVGSSTDTDANLRIDHENSGGIGRLEVNAHGSANVQLISNFSGSTVHGVPDDVFGLSTPHPYPINFCTHGTERFRITATGTFLHGSGAVATQKATNGGFDIACNNYSLIIGADSNSGNNTQARTDNTAKDGRIGHVHYHNSEEPIGIVRCYSDGANNYVYFGGGSSIFNAATMLSFYTAANDATTNGTERLRIGSQGQFGIGSNYGSSGQVMTSGGPSAAPSWQTPSAGVSVSDNNTWTGVNTFNGSTNLQGSVYTDDNNMFRQQGYFTTNTSNQNTNSSTNSYAFGYQMSGSWTSPYPDLILGYHTGIRIGAHTSYHGVRFYADHPNATSSKLFSIGEGDGQTRCYNNFLPSSNGSLNLGNSSYRWANLYTSDLSLSNEASGPNDVDGTWGDWTLQEGENDIFMINNRTGKKFAINMTEVS